MALKNTSRRKRSPLWARLCLAFGAVIILATGAGAVCFKLFKTAAFSGVTQQSLLGDAGTQATTRGQVEIAGAKTILLIGVDARPGQKESDTVRSDSIMIAYIPETHDSVYMVSIPRDTIVRIPANDNGVFKYAGAREKINAAYAYGGWHLTGAKAKGAAVNLLAKTIRQEFGITCDAAAIVDFNGFRDVVGVLGGVDMVVDQDTKSIHVGVARDGQIKVPYKQRERSDGGVDLVPVPGVSPTVYRMGQHHLTAHEALDFVRQRDTLPNSDYDRQRHQQQFIKAVVKQIVAGNTLANPIKLAQIMDAMGKAMTIDGGGIPLEDWAYSMRNIRGDAIVTLKTNNGTFHASTGGGGEAIDERTMAMFKAVGSGTIADFVAANPDLVTQS